MLGGDADIMFLSCIYVNMWRITYVHGGHFENKDGGRHDDMT
jgi:hypothetical protein